MEKLKFKKDANPIGLSDDFWYAIYAGGWASPENFLEEEDAIKIRNAIELIRQYEVQGTEEGFFEEM